MEGKAFMPLMRNKCAWMSPRSAHSLHCGEETGTVIRVCRFWAVISVESQKHSGIAHVTVYPST